VPAAAALLAAHPARFTAASAQAWVQERRALLVMRAAVRPRHALVPLTARTEQPDRTTPAGIRT